MRKGSTEPKLLNLVNEKSSMTKPSSFISEQPLEHELALLPTTYLCYD